MTKTQSKVVTERLRGLREPQYLVERTEDTVLRYGYLGGCSTVYRVQAPFAVRPYKPQFRDWLTVRKLYALRGSRYLCVGFIFNKPDVVSDWELRVRTYEEQGLTRSDAQAVVDAEDSARKDSIRE